MVNKINSKAIIILPTYNEVANIEFIIKDIMLELSDVSIVVVDDNSPDGTAKVVKKLISNYSNLSLIERPIRTGLGNAYKDTILRIIADGRDFDFFITMDADGSHQPKYLKDFLKQAANYDLVIGSRYMTGGGIENWEFWRRMLSRFGNLYSKKLTGIKINDTTSGFMCVRKSLLEKIKFEEIDCTGYAYLIEFKFYCVSRLGAKFKEIPIIFKERGRGESKISNRIIMEGIKAPAKIFLNRILKRREQKF